MIRCRHCNDPGFNYKQDIMVDYDTDDDDIVYTSINIPLCEICVQVHEKYGIKLYKCICGRKNHLRSDGSDGFPICYNSIDLARNNKNTLFKFWSYSDLEIEKCKISFKKLITNQKLFKPIYGLHLVIKEFNQIKSDPQYVFRDLLPELIDIIHTILLDFIKDSF